MISLKMQEMVLKNYRKLKNFLGGFIYDLAPPPLKNTLRGPCSLNSTQKIRAEFGHYYLFYNVFI